MGYVKEAPNLFVGAGYAEQPTVLSHLPKDAHDDAESGAVHEFTWVKSNTNLRAPCSISEFNSVSVSLRRVPKVKRPAHETPVMSGSN